MVIKREVQVFISCPSDVVNEKSIIENICKDFTSNFEQHCNVTFRTKDWSTVVGSLGSRPQGDINDQIGEYDIYMGIWHTRFGSKTGEINPATQTEFESGTQEEFFIAEERYKSHKAPQIYLFFRDYVVPSSKDTAFLRKAVDQKEKIDAFQTEQMKKGWVYCYNEETQFQREAHRILQKWALDFCLSKKSDERKVVVETNGIDLESLRHQYPIPEQPYIVRSYSRSNFGDNSNALRYFEQGPQDLLELVSSERRIVLLGDAGAGKSMELASLANRFSQENAPFLAVYKKLNLYSPQIGLTQFLGEQWLKIPEEMLVVLLDGLDEIAPVHFDDVVNQILFFAEQHSGIRMIVSCRTNFFVSPESGMGGTLPGFVPYYLEPFGREDILRFYREKFPTGNPETFLQALAESDLGDLVTRPYFLMELANLHHQRGNLDLSRAELLGLFMETRIKIDKIHFAGVMDITARKKVFRELIERIALSISILGTNIISENDLLEMVNVEEFEQLKYCAALKREETEIPIWRFEHNNLQEYLAASALSRLPFPKLLSLITFEPDNEKIIPTWVNTLTFLYAILDANSPLLSTLTDWLIKNEPEVIVKMEADKIDPSERTMLFRKIYGEFEKNAHLVRSNTFSTRELAKFGDSRETVDYLIEQLSNPLTPKINRINSINLLGFFDYSAPQKRKSVGDAMIAIVRENSDDVDLVHNAIYALWCAKINEAWVLSAILGSIGANETSYIRSSVYALLSNSSSIDSYVGYILDGLRVLKNRSKSPNETRLGDESWHLQHCITAIREKDSLLKIIGFFRKDRFLDYGFDNKELFDGIVNNAINLFPNAPEIFTIMFSWWREQYNYFSQGDAGRLLPFFTRTQTRDRAFREIWQQTKIEVHEKFMLLAGMASESSISYIIKEYVDRNATRNDINMLYQQLNWAKSPLTAQFEQKAERDGFTVEKPTTRDLRAETAARRNRDFATLFDKDTWIASINEIFDKEGKEKITFEDLYEIRRGNNKQQELEEIYSGSGLRLLKDFCKPGESVKRTEVINWFNEEQNFEGYRITLIYEHLTNNKDLVLTESQKEWLANWCFKTAPIVNWKTSIRKKENGATLNTFALIIVYLVKTLEIVLPETTMLDMLYFDYRDENTGGVLNYVESKISRTLVIQRVTSNLKERIEVDFVLQNYVRFIATRQITEAYPYIRSEIANQQRPDYFRLSILETYYKGTQDNAGLFELLPISDKAIQHAILDYLIDTDQRSKIETFVLVQFAGEVDEKERSKLAEYLIRLKRKEGIGYLIAQLKRGTYNEHPFERPGVLSHLSSIDMLPVLLNILEFGCLDQIHLNRYESLVSATLQPIYNMGIANEDNFRSVMRTLEQWLIEKGENFPGIDTVKDYLKRMSAQFYMNKARTSTIQDVKRKLETLGS